MQIDALIVLPTGYRKSNIVDQQYKISIVTTLASLLITSYALGV
jgi:hypothetical protein